MEYPIVGVLNRGRGILTRDAVTTDSTKYKQLNRVGEGSVIYSKLKAFEGAITVVPPMSTTVYASSEFPTFACLNNVEPAFMKLVTQQPSFWEEMALLSRGIGGRRERISPEDFLSLSILLPSLEEQLRIVDLMGSVDDAIEAATEQTQALLVALAMARNLIWSVDERKPLSELCTVDGSLVDPTTAETRALPHVGTDRITSGTGDLVGVQTAAEDGVTSGKFRFHDSHVIYSKIRPLLRKVAVPDFAGVCSADAYPLLPSVGRSRVFLQQLLLSDTFTTEAAARSGRTKMPKINKSELMTILVPFHSLESEAALASLFEGLDRARAGSATLGESLRTLRAELLSSLLSGAHRIPETYDELMGA